MRRTKTKSSKPNIEEKENFWCIAYSSRCFFDSTRLVVGMDPPPLSISFSSKFPGKKREV
jgi:hypothetical protein